MRFSLRAFLVVVCTLGLVVSFNMMLFANVDVLKKMYGKAYDTITGAMVSRTTSSPTYSPVEAWEKTTEREEDEFWDSLNDTSVDKPVSVYEEVETRGHS